MLGWLTDTSRLCRGRGQAFAFFNAPRALTGYIRAFHLESEMPSFFSPPALRAWLSIGEAGKMNPESTCRLSAPACFQGDATRFLAESVTELDRALPQGTGIAVDLRRTPRIDSRAGGVLALLKDKLATYGRSIHVDRLSAGVGETLRLLRLHAFLSESSVSSHPAEAIPPASIPVQAGFTLTSPAYEAETTALRA